MHADQGAYHFQMAEFFGADIHKKILARWIFAVKALDGILHRCRQLSVCSAKLFKQHVAKARIRFAYIDGVHQFLHMVIHCYSFC